MTTTTKNHTQRPRVELDSRALTIHHLVISEADVLTGARRHLDHPGGPDDDPHERLVRYTASALSVGARALAVVESSLDLAALDRSIAGLSDKVETSTRQALDALATAVTAATDPTEGAIPRSVETTLTGMVEQVTALVAGRDAPVPTAVTEAVRAVTEQTLSEVQRAVAAQADAVRRVLATDAPGSPLHDLKKGLVEGLNESHRRLAGQLAELRTALEVDKARTEATAQAVAKAPAHGLGFEDTILLALEPLAYSAGDTLTPTGTTTGAIPRALSGDAVIELAPNPALPGRRARIVIEAKDRDRRASTTAWAQELERAQTNRGAVAALAVLRRPEQMPGSPRRLHILSPTEYLVAYDPAAGDDPDVLTAAYLLLRGHAWAAVLDDHGDHDIDLTALRTGLADALECLDGFDTLTRHATGARKQLDDLDKATLALRTSLRGRLEATLRLLDPAQAGTVDAA